MNNKTKKVRKSTLAGTYYPANTQELKYLISKEISKSQKHDFVTSIKSTPKVLIIPCDKYDFTLSVMIEAFSYLMPYKDRIHKVAIISSLTGDNLNSGFDNVFIPSDTHFLSAFGELKVELQSLLPLPYIVTNNRYHTHEAGIEIVLPLLQEFLLNESLEYDFTIMPLLNGRIHPQKISELISKLWSMDDTLIVMTTNLSQFYPHALAQRLDKVTASQIEMCQQISPTSVSSAYAINGLLNFLKKNNLMAPKRLSMKTSADSSKGNKASVTGYGAWICIDSPCS